MSGTEVLDRFYGALANGDVDAARACATPDFVAWHSFDQREEDLEVASDGWRQMIAQFPGRAFVDVRRSPVPGGWVQRQTFVGTTAGGDVMAWPVCLFFTLREGRIARLEEYLDRAGRFAPAPGDQATPGLPPRSGHGVVQT